MVQDRGDDIGRKSHDATLARTGARRRVLDAGDAAHLWQDAAVTAPEPARPNHRVDRASAAPNLPVDVLLVALGGAVGTAARVGLGVLIPAGGGIVWATVAANLVGSLALGILLGALGTRLETAAVRRARLALGTGLLGGFTTYSALAVEAVGLGATPALAVTYAVGSVIAGLAAAGLGLVVGRRMRGSRPNPGASA